MSISRKSVRVAIAGVGNCASSLVQGVQFYRDADAIARADKIGEAGASS